MRIRGVVRDKVPMWEYEKISPNSEVTIDVAEGKLTGLLHTVQSIKNLVSKIGLRVIECVKQLGIEVLNVCKVFCSRIHIAHFFQIIIEPQSIVGTVGRNATSHAQS